jgi:hypothetical protein
MHLTSCVKEELDFALEIFKVSYVKKRFDGPYAACFLKFFSLLPASFSDFAFRHTLALRVLDSVIETPHMTEEAKLAVLPTITLQFVHDTFIRFLRDVHVTAFSCGSVTRDTAVAVCRSKHYSILLHLSCQQRLAGRSLSNCATAILQPQLPQALHRRLPSAVQHSYPTTALQSGYCAFSLLFFRNISCYHHLERRCLPSDGVTSLTCVQVSSCWF